MWYSRPNFENTFKYLLTKVSLTAINVFLTGMPQVGIILPNRIFPTAKDVIFQQGKKF